VTWHTRHVAVHCSFQFYAYAYALCFLGALVEEIIIILNGKVGRKQDA
jgi:hypothetical protein